MKHRLFTVTLLLSVLLAAATCVLWARSYWETQFIGWSDSRQWFGILSMAGLLRFEHGTYAPDAGSGWSYVAYATPQGKPPGLWGEVKARDRAGGFLRQIGIAYARIDYNFDGKNVRYAIYVPHCLPLVLLLIAPAIWLKSKCRHRKVPGHCHVCGYDLRASTDRCPECGTATTLSQKHGTAYE